VHKYLSIYQWQYFLCLVEESRYKTSEAWRTPYAQKDKRKKGINILFLFSLNNSIGNQQALLNWLSKAKSEKEYNLYQIQMYTLSTIYCYINKPPLFANLMGVLNGYFSGQTCRAYNVERKSSCPGRHKSLFNYAA
jgi:hypothetical protein